MKGSLKEFLHQFETLRWCCYFVALTLQNLIVKPYIKLFGRHDKRKMKYKVSLCLFFKDEAPFLKEWIDYHHVIGVDHFYLYNNESSDNFREVLAPYIDQGLVTLIDYPGRSVQPSAAKDCWERFRAETNWIGFLDADEFVCPKYKSDIGEWLKEWDKWPSIMIKWVMFGTSGLLKHDFSRLVIEQYTSCDDKFWSLGKCFVNTRFDICYFDASIMHATTTFYRILGIKFPLLPMGQFGKFTLPPRWPKEKAENLRKATIQINHYYTKAWAELCKRSITPRGCGGTSRRSKATVLEREESCVSKDYTIQRFLIRLKIAQGKITDLPFTED